MPKQCDAVGKLRSMTATPSDLTSDLAYADLVRLHDENCEPFETLEQCNLFLRVATRLRRITPEETDSSGNKIRMRDLLDGIEQARRYRAIYGITQNQKPTVIVPTDCLQ